MLASTIFVCRVNLLLSKYHGLDDAVRERNQNDSEDCDEEVVEGWIVVIEELLLLSMEVILKARHIPLESI